MNRRKIRTRRAYSYDAIVQSGTLPDGAIVNASGAGLLNSGGIQLVSTSLSVPSLGLAGQSNAGGLDTGIRLWNRFAADSRVDYLDTINSLSTLAPRAADGNEFGCELTLANGMATRQLASGKVWFRKTYVVNTKIDTWIPGGANNAALGTMLAAMNGHSGVTKHLLVWWQGEADASVAGVSGDPDANYLANLRTLATYIRATLDAPVRLVIVLLNALQTAPGGVLALNGLPIRHAQETFVSTDSDAVSVSTDDIDPNNSGGTGLHFGAGQMLDIGARICSSVAAPYYEAA